MLHFEPVTKITNNSHSSAGNLMVVFLLSCYGHSQARPKSCKMSLKYYNVLSLSHTLLITADVAKNSVHSKLNNRKKTVKMLQLKEL